MKKRILSLLVCGLLTVGLLPPPALAAAAPVEYLPGVTKEMTDPAFWTARMEDPDELLATAEEIGRLNAAALAAGEANMHDLRNLPETFNGVSRSASLPKGAASDAKYYLGWTYDETGKKLEQEDFDVMIANCADPDAAEEMPLRYGVVVNRALMVTFPYEGQILDDPVDFDFDYQGLVGLRVNEPVAVFTASADGKFYQIYNSCCSGWVRAEDVALCRDREEWLSAWDFPAEKRLVFWGDKTYTDYSKTAPETSGRLITMGTVLERMDAPEDGGLVINRLPLHNYAVYLPVRNEDGSYGKKPALIREKENVSEGYLPLTGRNLAKLALISLGDAYGWGGTLNNEDCTGLNRSIFLCFGLDLPRNGNWQWPLPISKTDVTDMCTEEKEALLAELPLGTLLTFPGHQMMYLGGTEGAFYAVSAVSSILGPDTGARQRTRAVQINKLDLKRPTGVMWLRAVNRIYLPWRSAEDTMPAPLWYHDGVAFCMKKNLIAADDDGYFRPGEAAARSVIAEALWRAAGKPEPGGDVEAFSDVEENASYARAALWAREQGVILGADGAFSADGTLTREQLVAILYRFLKPETEEGAENLADFADAGAVSDWARDAMNWAVGAHLIQGRSGTELKPGDAVTRAELAVILYRASTL